MKKLFALFLSLAMVLSLAACGGGNKPADPAPAESAAPAASLGTVGLSVSTMENPFFVTLTDGAKSAAADANIDLITTDAGDDAAKQNADIEELIGKNIDVLIVNPVDSDAVASAVQAAQEKGIKVIAVDRKVNGVDVDCSISSDNHDGAAMATEYIINTLGEDAKVAEITGTPNASATIERGEGFRSVILPGEDIVNGDGTAVVSIPSECGNFSREDGKAAMEAILAATPDVQAVFAQNDEMALGAIEAIGDKDIMIVGFDATEDGLAAIKDGKMAATVAQRPELMGETAVETAAKLLNGKNILKDIPVDVHLVTAENAG